MKTAMTRLIQVLFGAAVLCTPAFGGIPTFYDTMTATSSICFSAFAGCLAGGVINHTGTVGSVGHDGVTDVNFNAAGFSGVFIGDLAYLGNAGQTITPLERFFTSNIVNTGTYQTEMLSLNLSGTGYLLRESPTLASTGSTSVTIGGGERHIASFFDIFTELSLDSGATWTPSDSATRFAAQDAPQSTPEPSTMLLMAGGVLLASGSRLRRNWLR